MDGHAVQFIIILSGLNNLTNRRRVVKTVTLYNIIKPVIKTKGFCARDRERERESSKEWSR